MLSKRRASTLMTEPVRPYHRSGTDYPSALHLGPRNRIDPVERHRWRPRLPSKLITVSIAVTKAQPKVVQQDCARGALQPARVGTGTLDCLMANDEKLGLFRI